ncbi:MAG: AI-2E family transporter [Muribaculaceae bacterium]|nr:AI-2E family transporter [Muribaculaceae bacterium]MDE7109705.1 AI-2E family transporter [Muribaculaceae bacterium]
MGKPFTFDRVVRIVITLVVLWGAIWLIGILKNVLLPFCLACLLSYIMEPFVEFNQRLLHVKKRVWAVFLTLFDVTLTIGLLVYFFTPIVADEIDQMGAILKNYSASRVTIPYLPSNITTEIENKLNISKIIATIDSGKGLSLLDKGESLITGTVDFFMHSVEWLLTFIYIIFILIDYNKLGEGFKLLLPGKYKAAILQIGEDVKDSMNKYFRSQMIIAGCAAVFYCIGFSIVGLPMAIVMGVIVGILYMIPYFQYITLIPVIVICFIYSLDGSVDFWPLFGQCLLVYVVSQCICDYILTPKIMGKSMGLNPAIILLSLSIWGTLLGIIGMIIALPLTTLLTAYYKKVIIDHKPLSSPTEI